MSTNPGYNDSHSGLFDNAVNVFNQRLSYSQKKANDYEWAKKCADYIDYMYSPLSDKERVDRIKMNYDLYNGIGSEAMRNYGESLEGKNLLSEEGYMGGYENIQHYPIIDQIAKAIVGEQQLRPLTPIATDSSELSVSDRKRKRMELLQQYIQQTIVQPIVQQITQKYLKDYGVEDPSQIPQEKQEEFQSQMQQEIDAMTPDEIDNYMRKDYKSPSETQAQAIIDFLMDKLDIKYNTDEGFKNLVITGEEIYRIGIRHNMPFIEIVDPMGFYEISRPNTNFIEDGIAAKYEQYVLYNDIYNWHGDEIGRKTSIKNKIDRLSNVNVAPSQVITDRMMKEGNFDALQNLPNYNTIAGQLALRNIFSGYSHAKKGGDIRYVHIVWKTLTKLKYITRILEDGTKDSFWIGENYTFNPLNGDIKEEEAWVPEVWECTKIGDGAEAIYLNIGPVKGQYKSLNNPWDVKLPYVGSKYSKLMNNTKNVAPMDLGKPWQYKFNIQMAKIHETEAADLGKIFLTSFHAKPKDWSWQKFMLMAKYGRILPIDLTQEGVTPADAQVFRTLDLSTDDKKAAQLQYLEFIRNQVSLAMSYNPSRLGLQGNSVSVSNNQQNIMQSSYQTYDIFNTHNKVIENLLNTLLNTARVALKDNEQMKTYILSDMSIAELDIDTELLDRSELGIKIKSSAQDLENVLEIKRLMQPMIQNGLISFPELIKAQFSKSAAELMNIADNAEAKMLKRQAEQQQAQQQAQQQQMEMQKQLQQMQQQFELLMQKNQLESRERQAQIESTRFAQQKDIDNDHRNDDLQMEEIKIQYDTYKLEQEIELKEKEMAIKELEIRLKYGADKDKLDNELKKLQEKHNLEREKENNKRNIERERLSTKLKETKIKTRKNA